MLSSSSSRFDSMPAHPPTPPRHISQAVDDAITFLDGSNEIDRALSKALFQRRPSLQAGAPSPAASQESTATSTAKKVGFSPHTICHHHPGHDRLDSPGGRVVKRSPSSRSSKPLKSILKFAHAPPPTPDDIESKLSYFSPDVPGSFGKMLQSVLSQLASQSVSNRLDAYMSLNGALQAYSDIPEPATLVKNLALLTQFLARDIAWKKEDGKLHTNIVFQALKLTNALIFNDSVSTAIDYDFRCFLIDRSTTVMESSDIPKQIMKAHIHLLAQQKLQSSAMTLQRADRLLSTLQTIEQRCSGNSVISSRLVIYQRLLEQAPSLMLTRARDWLEQTFHCMLSSINDIRGRAIDLCTKGGIKLGTQPHAAKALCDLLETEIEEGQSYYNYFNAKLMEMFEVTEMGPCVPRICAALVLYFRNRRKPLEKWARLKSWLSIMQKCFNSSNISIRYEATLAWNKMVYTTTFDNSPSLAMMKMAKSPILSGIERRGNDAFSRHIRQYTLDCYFNLLHYAFRPTLPTEQLAMTWDTLVDPVLATMVEASSKGRATACRILHGLCSSNGGVWNANAALMTTPIKPEDLPRLDPRWIRSHIAKVLKLVQPTVEASVSLNSELNVMLMPAWTAIMQTVLEAGAQEVRTSSDLKQAIALLTRFFRQLWASSMEPLSATGMRSRTSNYFSLLDAMITTIGPGHFIEDFLVTSESDEVEVAPTPSTKRSKRFGAPQSPMVILLGQFFRAGHIKPDAESIGQVAIGDVLDRFVSSRPTILARLDLLSRTYHTMQSSTIESLDAFDENLLWDIFASSTALVLQPNAAPQEPQPGNLGQCLKHSMDIFSSGLGAVPIHSSLSSITALYDAMYQAAKDSAGDGGIVVAVAEPAARAIVACGPALDLGRRVQLTSHILSKSTWPKNRQSLETARKALWGVGLASHKSPLFDPFDHLYALVVEVMNSLYVDLGESGSVDLDTGRNLFSAAIEFLEKAPLSLLLTGLRQTQKGFALWVVDEERKTAATAELSEQIIATWTALLKLMRSLPSSDSNVLRTLEALLVAGFASPHRQVVNDTIVFWNAKFGAQESLEYPSELESVIRARQADASIDLPTFPDSDAERVPAILPEFYESESQAAISIPARNVPPAEQLREDTARKAQPAQSVYFTAQKSPAAKSLTIPSSEGRRSRASGSSTPKARLRHDDSQIQFAPIDSSPMRSVDESQHLTEHQKEVTARQNQDAQMFPELSSSPMAQSTALPRAFPKRLDFSSETRISEEGEDFGTPTGLPDAAGLMSDDMPSSPTPSSTKVASQVALDVDDDQVTEDELDEPPSSPPKRNDEDEPQSPAPKNHAAGPDDTTVVATEFALMDDEDVDGEGRAGPVDHEGTPKPGNAAETSESLHFPSDSILPTEQLQLEAEAAEIVKTTSNIEAVGAEEQQDEGASSQDAAAETHEQDVTRVEDSFIGHAKADTPEHVEEAAEDSQGSRRSTRKRKRPSFPDYASNSNAKKQKSASPFKRFMSKIWPSSQQDDDDMEDEIVVASSQRSHSPANTQVPPPEEAAWQPSQPPEETTEIKSDVMAPPPKRKPGRPRKSVTPNPALSQCQEEPSQTRSLKRRASVLSNTSAGETGASSSFVKDTPAPVKSRRGRKGQTASQTSEASSSQQDSLGPLTRRMATAVVVPHPSVEAQAEAEDVGETAGEDIEVSTPQKQQGTSCAAAAAVEDRPKLTPKSILGRLRDALSDFVGMKVTGTEAREFDDVLFEFRREVHEADRRGRAE